MKFSDLPRPPSERPKTPERQDPAPQPALTPPKPPQAGTAPGPVPERGLPTKSLFSSLGPKAGEPAAAQAPPAPASAAPQRQTSQELAHALSSLAQLQEQRQRAHRIYGDAVALMRLVLQHIGQKPLEGAVKELRAVVGRMLDELESGSQALVALTTRSTASNYLYAHTVNVTILSLHIARGLGWSRDHLSLLGLAAALHDVGMTKYLGLVQSARGLTEDEEREIRQHPLEAGRLVGHLHELEESTKAMVSEILSQVHERPDGSGYPRGLSRVEDLTHGAQIIGICDTYEAMSHHRSWREALLPHEALKAIVRQHASQFEPGLVRTFAELMTLFPPGSWVQLSTGEAACVAQVNRRSLTRPVVEIRVRADGGRQDPPLVIDLAENPMTHVTRALDETRLHAGDKKLSLQLQAGRWWTE